MPFGLCSGSQIRGNYGISSIDPPKAGLIRFYGLEGRAIPNPIRSCDLTGQDMEGLFDRTIFESSVKPKFEAVAKDCIRDGAEVVICDDA